MIKRTVALVVFLAILGFVGFWLLLPFIIGSIVVVIGVTYYQRYKPQTRLPSEGKAVLITGCDSGFGNMLAERLDKMGYQVFAACLFPHKDGALELKARCSEQLRILALDVTNERQVTRALQFIQINLLTNYKLWAVVNNAGLGAFCPAEWTPISSYEKTMSVNFFGMVKVCKAFLPLLRESKGRVVNVSSIAGRFSLRGSASYAASKYAAIGFSDALRREVQSLGVRVITIEPAMYKTAISDRIKDDLAQSWAELPEPLKSGYGERFYTNLYERVDKQLAKASSDIQEVIDCMADAVSSTNPSTRYVPGNIMKGLVLDVFSLAPNWIMDRIM